MIKKRFISRFLLVLLTAGCRSSQAAGAEDMVVLDGSGPFTGSYAVYGISERNGAIPAAWGIGPGAHGISIY